MKTVVDHIAIEVQDLQRAVDWYRARFTFDILYQDATWAFLQFENVRLALVLPQQHPAHVSYLSDEPGRHGKIRAHRDGTQYVYVKDSEGNTVEFMLPYSGEQLGKQNPSSKGTA